MEAVKIKTTYEIDWKAMGEKVAALGSDQQALFLIGFAQGLEAYGNQYKKEMQMHCIFDALDVKTKETLREFLPLIWTRPA